MPTVRQALRQSAPYGRTLEIACGTGLWTGTLAEGAESLMAIDSVAETLVINREKNPDAGIDFQVANAFQLRSENAFDFIFFGFWLSHVPASRFESFWSSLARSLRPKGRIFFVDSLKAQRSTANDHHELDDSGVVTRQLNSGEKFRIVKRFYQPEPLLAQLTELGWTGSIEASGEFFLYGCLERPGTSKAKPRFTGGRQD